MDLDVVAKTTVGGMAELSDKIDGDDFNDHFSAHPTVMTSAVRQCQSRGARGWRTGRKEKTTTG